MREKQKKSRREKRKEKDVMAERYDDGWMVNVRICIVVCRFSSFYEHGPLSLSVCTGDTRDFLSVVFFAPRFLDLKVSASGIEHNTLEGNGTVGGCIYMMF